MTPEQTKSAYQRVCEQECRFCKKYIPRIEPTAGTPQAMHRFEYATSMDDDFPCTAPSKESFMERQAAQIAAMQSALAIGGHGIQCAKYPDSSIDLPCGCHLSTLSDSIARGRELLEKEAELAKLKGESNA